MSCIARAWLAALALVVPASAGTAAVSRPSLALTASPAHVTLEGSGNTTVRVSNIGSRRVVVDVQRAGFGLDLRGNPKILPRRRSRIARSWLTVRPRRFVLRAGGRTSLTVSARLPHRADAGDHEALVLLVTRPRRRAGVAVRMRLGVVVDVRAPGRVVRRLALRGLEVRPHGRLRTLELLVINRGNVTEEIGEDRGSLTLRRRGHLLARLQAEPRQLLPRSRGLVLFRYRGRARGYVSALAALPSDSGGAVAYRTFRVRL
jgi:hypothetical protein